MLDVDDILEIIDYVENFDEKGIQLAILSSPLRSGLLLLHSLLDSHPQLLHVPIPFYYFFDWEYTLQYSPPETLVDDFFSKSDMLLPGIPHLGPERNITLDLNFEILSKIMKMVSKHLKPLNRKSFFLLFHFVYAKYNRINLDNIKVILHHHHSVPNVFGYAGFQIYKQRSVSKELLDPLLALSSPQYTGTEDWFLQGILSDFQHLKLIVPIRHPMAAIYSGIKRLQGTSQGHANASDLSLHFLVSYLSLMNYYNLYPLQQGLVPPCKIVKFEEVHCHTEQTMKDLAVFLGVDFREAMLSSTFGGHLWSGSMATDKIIFGTDPQIIEQDTTWKTDWDEGSQAFYGTLCRPLCERFNYEIDVKTMSLDFSSLQEGEAQMHQQYPGFMMNIFEEVIQDIQQYNPSPAVYKAFDEQLALFESRMRFWLHYPEIRKQVLQYLQREALD